MTACGPRPFWINALEDDMVHFFGILHPGQQDRHTSGEAPAKTSFFGGLPDAAFGAVPMSRVEQDACYLNGKAQEPAVRDFHAADRSAR